MCLTADNICAARSTLLTFQSAGQREVGSRKGCHIQVQPQRIFYMIEMTESEPVHTNPDQISTKS